MKRGSIILMVVLGILILITISVINLFVSTRKSLEVLEISVNSYWTEIESEHKQRRGLVPELINVAEGSIDTQDIILVITKTIALIDSAVTTQEKIETNIMLDSALTQSIEALKGMKKLVSNSDYESALTKLDSVGNKLDSSRARYNEAATEYNIIVQQFPSSLVASIYKFEAKLMYTTVAASVDSAEVENK